MYKLTLGSLNEIKYSDTDAHGLFSGTIETDRVVLVNEDGAYLQVDGNFGTELKNGLVRTYSATRDSAETAYMIATTNATGTAAVFIYDGIMKLQSDFSDVDGFIEYLVDELHLIDVQGYENPKYELSTATVKTAGSGYTAASIDVEVPGETGDTVGVVTVTITEGACSAAEIKSAGSYEKMVATQDLTVGTGNGEITVTMAAVSDEADAGTLSLSPSPSLNLGKGDMKPMVQPQVEPIVQPQVVEPEVTDTPVEETTEETTEETVVETPAEEVSEPAQEETPVAQDEVVSEPEEVVEEPVAEESSEPEEVAEVTEEPKQEEEPVEE